MGRRTSAKIFRQRTVVGCLSTVVLMIGSMAVLAADLPLRANRAPIRVNRRQAGGKPAKPAVSKDESKSGRYQLITAGERVVVFDSLTGEAKIIEPARKAPYQNVEVGRAWVVVTVLGNVAEHTAESRSSDK